MDFLDKTNYSMIVNSVK